MSTRSKHTARRTALIFSCLIVSVGLVRAQNENETVGFQSNHIFESGQFGEDIDVLNGGLHLTTPIGPRYQVNDRLSYQLALHYNSKIWEYTDYSGASGNSIKLIGEGPAGLGFNLSFGRLLQDAHNNPASGYDRTWKWITPDGNQHDVWLGQGSTTQPISNEYPLVPGDTSYIRVSNTGCSSVLPSPCMTVSTPDGLTYTVSHHVYYAETTDQDLRADNLSFGGWYVTRIEDRSIGTDNVTNSFGTTGPVTGLYPNHVVIIYDTTHANYDHVIKEIRDSRGRVITFTNCRYTSSTTCVIDQPATDRSEVAIKEISLPAFSVANANAGSEALDSGATAVYRFSYLYGTVNRFHPAPGGLTVAPAGPTLQLKRVDYPEYVHRDTSHETYSLYFDYGHYAELSCRTLPLPKDESKSCGDWLGQPPSFSGARTVLEYDYGQYMYLPMWLAMASHHLTFYVQDGTPTRHVSAKRVVEPVPNGQVTRTWSYVRDMAPATTNPYRVTLTDAAGNDTVYYYHASYYPTNQTPNDHVGADPEDGLAPEWNDGLNHKIEYYRGTGTGRTLLRTENRDYDADALNLGGQVERTKKNTRVRRTATVFNDAGGSEGIVSNSGWDGFGNWRTVSESGFGVQGVRNIHTDTYTLDTSVPFGTKRIYLTGLANYTETHDGFRVLARSDNFYDSSDGRLNVTIARKTLPATLGSLKQASFQKGDVKTTYDLDPNTRLIRTKTVASGGDGQGLDYCIDYAWTGDAHLKTKTFRSLDPGGQCASPLLWKAVDRKRDGNTGLIHSVKDTAGIETGYRYDALGRLTDIKPVSPEYATEIDYVDLQTTTVTRKSTIPTDFVFSRYRYDDQGRLTCEEKRPAGTTTDYPYQTTRYDSLGRAVFKSEWLLPGTSPCNAATTVGTTFDFGSPPDPFGRVQTTTTVDGKVTTTTYQGQDSTVTVEGVVGPGGVAGAVTTKYFRDAWGRLLKVDAPSTGGADAVYTYDLRDNLIRADLYDQANPLIKQTRYFEYDGLNKLFQGISSPSPVWC